MQGVSKMFIRNLGIGEISEMITSIKFFCNAPSKNPPSPHQLKNDLHIRLPYYVGPQTVPTSIDSAAQNKAAFEEQPSIHLSTTAL